MRGNPVATMSIQESLEALLKAEVDKRVSAIQAEADKAVAAFRALVESIAAGEGVTHQEPTVTPSVPLVVRPVAPEAPQDMPAFMKPPADEVMPTYQVTNETAMLANMSPR